MKTILLTAENGKYYKNGSMYAKIVRVKNEWAEDWTLVTEEEANADTSRNKVKQLLHVLKRKL